MTSNEDSRPLDAIPGPSYAAQGLMKTVVLLRDDDDYNQFVGGASHQV